MTVYTPNQIGALWQAQGGAFVHVITAIAVSLAESGGDSSAISPSHDYGLWQINEANFAALGVSLDTIRDPATNARCAIRMSGNGTNWAAWCTAWTDPGRDCGHGLLPAPQVGSPAYSKINEAAAYTGGVVPAGTTAPAGVAATNTGKAVAAWGDVGRFVHPDLSTRHNRWAGLRTASRSLIT